jgi:hypothetical protein
MHALKSPLLHRDLKVSLVSPLTGNANDADRERPIHP